MQKYKRKRILRPASFKLSILITKFQYLITPVILTGCMGVYEGGFECSPERGVGCKSISEVNEMVNQYSVSSIQDSEKEHALSRERQTLEHEDSSEHRTLNTEHSIWYSPLFIKDQLTKPRPREKWDLVT